MGRKAKSTEINKINISPSESITKAKDIANTLNTHFTEISPKLATKILSNPTRNRLGAASIFMLPRLASN